MRQSLEQLTPELQEMVLDATKYVNSRQYPEDWAALKIPILKPIQWEFLPDDTRAGEVPKWIAEFRRNEAGQYVFKYLHDG